MKINAKIISILFIALISCKNKSSKVDFYSYTKRSDLWRVPLLEPYEIVSPTNTDDWFFVIKKPKLSHKDYFNPGNEYGFQLSFIDSVAVTDSLLILKSKRHYWPKLSGDYKTTLIVDAKTGEQFIYSDEHHWQEMEQKMRSLGILDAKLYKFEEVKEQFQKNMTLPKGWR